MSLSGSVTFTQSSVFGDYKACKIEEPRPLVITGTVEVCILFCWNVLSSVEFHPDTPTPSDFIPQPPRLPCVICSELHRQGRLSSRLLDADHAFGRRLDPTVYAGYRLWADHVVGLMSVSPLFTQAVEVFSTPWIHHMAYVERAVKDDSVVGQSLMRVGAPICSCLAQIQTFAARRLSAPLLQLIWWAYSAFVHCCLILTAICVWLLILGPQLLANSLLGMMGLGGQASPLAICLGAQTVLFATIVVPLTQWSARRAA